MRPAGCKPNKSQIYNIMKLKQTLADCHTYGGKITVSCAANTTGSVEVDLNAEFSEITSVVASYGGSEPQTVPAAASISGKKVTVYCHNNSGYNLFPEVFYAACGTKA